MHTIKPIDRQAIIDAARDTGAIVTAEEHSVIGGLGGAVSEVVCETIPVPVVKVGVEDVFGRSGPAVELLHIYGLDAENIVKKQSRRLSSRLPAENRPKGFQMAKSRFKKSTVAVAAAIIVVFAAAATAALIFLMSGKNKIPDADSQAIVYKSTDGGTYLSAYGKSTS